MKENTIVTPPNICGLTEIELAHTQMQRHRACRTDRCAWKWVAYHTLVHHNRLTPQKMTLRERAQMRGINFAADDVDHELAPGSRPEDMTFQEVLDALSKLAHDMRMRPGDSCDRQVTTTGENEVS
ncbi:hypothetical protein [Nocardia transvalensis]|uniref:hypothetical protein n=1 Tax=Nocardia transvalensis TaxID=37333 RepID=UPI00189590E8|nr:hypothetical protein [Nocardia transvalensis]MBF6332441.1 hypothetical protein [Nocardia transvalensis]